MVTADSISFGPTLARFRRLRYRAYHLFLPRGLALRLESWEIHRLYDRLIERARPDEREVLIGEAVAEIHEVTERISVHYSTKLVDKARRLFLPVPRIQRETEDPNWEEADFGDRCYLKPDGMQRLLAAVRAEQKQRREVAAFWLGTVGGILIALIGALTGLAAVLKK